MNYPLIHPGNARNWLGMIAAGVIFCALICIGIVNINCIEKLPEGAKFKRVGGFGYSYEDVQHFTFNNVSRFIIKEKTKWYEPARYDTALTDEFWEDSVKFVCYHHKGENTFARAYTKSLCTLWLIEETGVKAKCQF